MRVCVGDLIPAHKAAHDDDRDPDSQQKHEDGDFESHVVHHEWAFLEGQHVKACGPAGQSIVLQAPSALSS